MLTHAELVSSLISHVGREFTAVPSPLPSRIGSSWTGRSTWAAAASDCADDHAVP